MAGTKLLAIFTAVTASTFCNGCETVWFNQEDPSRSLEDDRAACEKQAFDETGKYNNTREFKIAKVQCLKDRGWKRSVEPNLDF